MCFLETDSIRCCAARENAIEPELIQRPPGLEQQVHARGHARERLTDECRRTTA
jgi:hypothetical protein